ncbi:MAG: hypothetical protein RMM08_04765 [Armatimonadota bacterium]|nr:hypothetical protein [bacterium]MDW8320654.1 hypothetical protein [Armatimonadota bacterium]
MRAYIRNVGTNVTMVDIDTGERLAVSASALQKLFGELPKEGDVWDYRANRLDEIADTFRKWQLVERA